MSLLAPRFPSLRGAAGLTPWNPDLFLAWTCRSETPLVAQYAGRFLLGLWNPDTDWEAMARRNGAAAPHHARTFTVFEAVATWDDAHLDAFRAWVDEPFLP